MKTKLLFVLMCTFTALSTAVAQEAPASTGNLMQNIYFDTGADFLFCSPPDDKRYIRGDVIPDPFYYQSSYVRSLFFKNYIGMKYEKRFLDNKLGILTGLRYTRTQSSIGKDSYWASRTDYFYLLLRQQGTNTAYLKVKDITEISHYLGIPLELRIYPYEERVVQMYYKIGADINFLLRGKTHVNFYNPGMSEYENEVSGIVEEPWPVYASVYLAVGLKIGKAEKPGVNIEACLPSFIVGNTNNAFVKPEYGAGIQLNIRFPL